MLLGRPGLLRFVAVATCGIMLVSFCGPALSSTFDALRKRTVAIKQGGGDFTDSPGAVDYGPYPFEDPTTRGYFYYSDDLTSISTSDTVEAGAASDPADPGYYSSGTADTGDDMVLAGRPDPLPRDQNNQGGGGNEPVVAWFEELLAATPGAAISAKPLPPSINLTELFGNLASANARTASAAIAKQGAGDGNGSGGVTGVGQGGPRAGQAFPWEGFDRAGGSSAAPAYVNTQTGNLMTVLPIAGWKVPGGMNIGLTLYHNSQDNLDIGWGMNWRSTFDMRIVNAATINGNGKVVVTYPQGLRLVFTNPHPTASNVYYPPTGFYDVVSILGRSINGAVNIFQLRTRNQITYLFGTGGYLIGITDRYGNHITINRALSHAISSVVDANGNTLHFSYSGSQYVGHYVSVTSPTGAAYGINVPQQSYNPLLWVLRTVTFPPQVNVQGAPTPTETFYYNLDATILHEIAKDGNSFGFGYDGTARLTSCSYPVNFYSDPFNPAGSNRLIYSYTYSGTATTRHDPYGHTTVENYSGGTLRSAVDEAGYSQTYTWDINYNCSQYKSERGYTSYFGYDNFGNMIQAQDPVQYGANKSQSWTWNSWNDVLTEKDTRGATTTFTRDPTRGYVLNVRDGLNNLLVTNTYNSAGQVLTSNSMNATTTVNYDGQGRPTSVQTPDQTYTIGYPIPAAHVLPNVPGSVTDGTGLTYTLSYDPWSRPVSVGRSADGALASVTYDAMNRVTDTFDWKNVHFQFGYDPAGRLTSAPMTGSLTWFDMDRLAGIQDPNSHLRKYFYTARGDVKGWQLADGQGETYQFDGDGDQTTRLNGVGNAIQYAFDSRDNLTTTTYPSGPGVSYAYDYDSRPSSMTDATGTTNWVFDLADRLTGFNSPQGNLSYTYDQWGRRTLLTEPSGISISYSYTGQRLMSLNKQPENETTSWSYDTFGRPLTQTNSNGTTATNGYDGLGRLASILHQTSSSSQILSEAYGYDADGQMTSKVSNGATTQYGYDVFGQLTTEFPNSPYLASTPGNVSYNYDGNGNRVSKVVTGAWTESYSYDSGDKLLAVTRNSGSGYLPYKSYGYDAAGRTTSVTNSQSGQNLALSYDYEDRITSITGLPTANSFTYNALDARVKKIDSAGSTNYLRDGADPTDAVLADGGAYVPGISRHTASGTRVYHQDFLGSNKAESDSSQTTQATRGYDAFGLNQGTTGSPSGSMGFAGGYGYQEDSDSGIKLLGHRYYDPSTGRFLTRDPAQSGSNWFACAANCPTRNVDPSGLFPMPGRWWFTTIAQIILWIVGIKSGLTKHTLHGPPPAKPPNVTGRRAKAGRKESRSEASDGDGGDDEPNCPGGARGRGGDRPAGQSPSPSAYGNFPVSDEGGTLPPAKSQDPPFDWGSLAEAVGCSAIIVLSFGGGLAATGVITIGGTASAGAGAAAAGGLGVIEGGAGGAAAVEGGAAIPPLAIAA